jgi:hypothetical protein
MTRVLSPVDYDAAHRGYTPPSEHILIDALQFRDAKVVFSSAVFGTQYWLVIRGVPVRGRRALAIMQAIEDTIAIMAEEPDEEPMPCIEGGADALAAMTTA